LAQLHARLELATCLVFPGAAEPLPIFPEFTVRIVVAIVHGHEIGRGDRLV